MDYGEAQDMILRAAEAPTAISTDLPALHQLAVAIATILVRNNLVSAPATKEDQAP